MSTPLTGQTTVLIGATGNVGHGLVRSHLDAGATVVIVGRSDERLQALRQKFTADRDRVIPVVGDVATLASAEQAARAVVEQVGRPDHVVIGLNAWMQGEPFWNVDQDNWDQALAVTTAYFAAARAFAPQISDGGSLTLMLGLSAYIALPLASPVTIYGGALRAMRPAFSGDAGDRIRVNSVAFAFIATPSRGANVSPDWITDQQVGQVIAHIQTSDLTATDVQIPDLPTYRQFIAN